MPCVDQCISDTDCVSRLVPRLFSRLHRVQTRHIWDHSYSWKGRSKLAWHLPFGHMEPCQGYGCLQTRENASLQLRSTEMPDCSFHLPVLQPRPSHTTPSTQTRLKERISYHKGTWKLPSTEARPGAFPLRAPPKRDLVYPSGSITGTRRGNQTTPSTLAWLKKTKNTSQN